MATTFDPMAMTLQRPEAPTRPDVGMRVARGIGTAIDAGTQIGMGVAQNVQQGRYIAQLKKQIEKGQNGQMQWYSQLEKENPEFAHSTYLLPPDKMPFDPKDPAAYYTHAADALDKWEKSQMANRKQGFEEGKYIDERAQSALEGQQVQDYVGNIMSSPQKPKDASQVIGGYLKQYGGDKIPKSLEAFADEWPSDIEIAEAKSRISKIFSGKKSNNEISPTDVRFIRTKELQTEGSLARTKKFQDALHKAYKKVREGVSWDLAKKPLEDMRDENGNPLYAGPGTKDDLLENILYLDKQIGRLEKINNEYSAASKIAPKEGSTLSEHLETSRAITKNDRQGPTIAQPSIFEQMASEDPENPTYIVPRADPMEDTFGSSGYMQSSGGRVEVFTDEDISDMLRNPQKYGIAGSPRPVNAQSIATLRAALQNRGR